MATAQNILDKVIDLGRDGFSGVSGGIELAQRYSNDKTFKSNEERARALILKEAVKCGATGFVTGLGGFITLPVTIPADIFFSTLIQARMCVAIAVIFGFDPNSPQSRIMIGVTLLGGNCEQLAKDFGVKFLKSGLTSLAEKLTEFSAKKTAEKISTKLLAKLCEKGSQGLLRSIPLVGGPVGGGFNYFSTRMIGHGAIRFCKESLQMA